MVPFKYLTSLFAACRYFFTGISVVLTKLSYCKCNIWPRTTCKVYQFSYKPLVGAKIGFLIIFWIRHFDE